MITAFTLHNSGGSDGGTLFTLAAAFWAASHEMSKTLTPKQLGRGSLSVPFLSNWERRYASECFTYKCFKMKKSSTKYLHFSGDHDHRNGQDGLVKGWSYASLNKNGERVIDFMCSDIYRWGHSSKEVITVIEKSFHRIQMHRNEEWNCRCLLRKWNGKRRSTYSNWTNFTI